MHSGADPGEGGGVRTPAVVVVEESKHKVAWLAFICSHV